MQTDLNDAIKAEAAKAGEYIEKLLHAASTTRNVRAKAAAILELARLGEKVKKLTSKLYRM